MKTTEFTGIRVEVETSLSFDEVNQRLQRSTGQATLQDMIIRNVGGRVTPSTIDTLAMLRQVTRAAGGDLGAGWNLVVLHHTDCGITRLGGAPKLLAGFFGISPDRACAKVFLYSSRQPSGAISMSTPASTAAAHRYFVHPGTCS